MAAPTTVPEFLDLVRKSGVVEEKRLEPHLERLRSSGTLPAEPVKVATQLVHDGILTRFQAEQLMLGKWRRFTIGKYKVLERLGSGGMGSVYLCEHKLMRRRVAVKVLPTAKAQDQASLERFYREARAVAALDHPNIVHAYDIDQDETLHFLVMEYVDGSSMQDLVKDLVKRTGQPLNPERAAHYIAQAAEGLQHAQDSGLVHRDIKPGNLLLDRAGTVKILDMGLARFFNDEEDILTRKYDENVLGTADYLAPEQAIDSHEVDGRVDTYSLGGTFYYLLTGKTPFGEGTVAQKLIWHQTRQPKPISSFRNDVPPEMMAVIEKMMAKDPAQRYQHPIEVAHALAPWTARPIPPPAESEMPRLSPAVTGIVHGGVTPTVGSPQAETSQGSSMRTTPVSPESPARRVVQSSVLPRSGERGNGPSSPTPTPVSPSRPAAMAPRSAPQPAPLLPTLPPTSRTNSTSTAVAAEPKATWEPRSLGESPQLELAEVVEDEQASVRLRRSHQVSPQERKRLWLVVTLIAVPFLVLSAVLVWWYLSRTPPVPLQERKPLEVSRTGQRPGAFTSIRNALERARPGDVIELWDEQHEENLTVAGPVTRVTVQAAPDRKVTWIGVRGQEFQPLLFINKAPGFRLNGKGITLDGQGKRERLISVSLSCPGLLLEDVELRGCTGNALQFTNAAGAPGSPIRVAGVRFVLNPATKMSRAIYFDATDGTSPDRDDHIDIERSCQFEGVPPAEAIARKDNVVTGQNIKLPPGGPEWWK